MGDEPIVNPVRLWDEDVDIVGHASVYKEGDKYKAHLFFKYNTPMRFDIAEKTRPVYAVLTIVSFFGPNEYAVRLRYNKPSEDSKPVEPL